MKRLRITLAEYISKQKETERLCTLTPSYRLQRVFESASKLPRRQQEKVAEFVEAFVAQHANEH